MATWWMTEPVPLWATGCIPLLAFPLLGIASPFAVVLQYFDPVNFLFLGGMMIAASMQQWGLHRRIALNIISAIGVSPRRIVLGFMLSTAFVSLWISNTATTVMMFPIGMAVLLKMGEQMGPDRSARPPLRPRADARHRVRGQHRRHRHEDRHGAEHHHGQAGLGRARCWIWTLRRG